MIQILQVLFLGFIQGITEFLPISSTGHLLIVEKIFGISQDKFGLGFDASLHLGTMLAIFIFYQKELFRFCLVIKDLVLHQKTKFIEDSKLLKLLFLSSIPAVIFGVLLESKIESVFRTEFVVAISLIIFSLVLLYVEKTGLKKLNISDLKTKDSWVIGFSQSIALIPGVSRSGITIAAGMWSGLKREQAAKYAFLLSFPIIAGAGSKKMLEALIIFSKGGLTGFDIFLYILGIISSAIFGYFTIKYFIKYISQKSLMPFIIYRILLGVIILVLIFLR